MKSLYQILLILLFAPLALAGPGHSHAHGHSDEKVAELSEEEIIKAATKRVAEAIETKKPVEGVPLDSTWEQVSDQEKSIVRKGKGFYILKFVQKEEDKNLFLLMSSSGELYDANFDGEFNGLAK